LKKIREEAEEAELFPYSWSLSLSSSVPLSSLTQKDKVEEE
jgi:hypothetical protein